MEANGQWRDRIVGEDSVNPKTLIPNPKNWRKHPSFQAGAMAAVLGNIGWVQRIVVNQRTGNLIDGHLRLELALNNDETEVPVIFVDLEEDEERVVLASLDPIGSMAETDHAMIESLLQEIDNEELDDVLKDIGERLGVNPPDFSGTGEDGAAKLDELDEQKQIKCPHCGTIFTP